MSVALAQQLDPPLVNVLLLNDKRTPQSFVTRLLEEALNKAPEEARRLMLATHRAGVSLVGRYPASEAKAVADRIDSKAHERSHALRCVLEPVVEHLPAPTGWITAGATPFLYDMGVNTTCVEKSAVIRFNAPAIPADHDEVGFGTLMQSISAEDYKGKVVKFSAELKAENVSGECTIWMRIDGQGDATLRFSNLCEQSVDGALSGTADWSRREIVFDVPHEASSINFGFFLHGRGTAWARNVQFEESEPDTATIAPAPPSPSSLPSKPVNLVFSLTG
jgi:ATP-dependent Clp protease adapter protein ClpS